MQTDLLTEMQIKIFHGVGDKLRVILPLQFMFMNGLRQFQYHFVDVMGRVVLRGGSIHHLDIALGDLIDSDDRQTSFLCCFSGKYTQNGKTDQRVDIRSRLVKTGGQRTLLHFIVGRCDILNVTGSNHMKKAVLRIIPFIDFTVITGIPRSVCPVSVLHRLYEAVQSAEGIGRNGRIKGSGQGSDHILDLIGIHKRKRGVV